MFHFPLAHEQVILRPCASSQVQPKTIWPVVSLICPYMGELVFVTSSERFLTAPFTWGYGDNPRKRHSSERIQLSPFELASSKVAFSGSPKEHFRCLVASTDSANCVFS